MAYVTGSAASFAALKTAIESACTSNGWTLTSDVLSNGDLYVQLTSAATSLSLQAGTGQDGSTLTGVISGMYGRLSDFTYSAATVAVAFPVDYYIHIFESPVPEVYVVIKYGDRYQHLQWGGSTVDLSGFSATGCWFYGSIADSTRALTFSLEGNNGTSSYPHNPVAHGYWHTISRGNRARQNQGIHLGSLYTGGWPILDASSELDTGEIIGAADLLHDLINFQPNGWDGEATLMPIQMGVALASNMSALVLDLQHARHLRIDNYAPGDNIVLGGDTWRVYPWHKKSTVAPAGGSTSAGYDHSGCLGVAIRYDGP